MLSNFQFPSLIVRAVLQRMVLPHTVSLQRSRNLGHHDHIPSDSIGCPSRGLGAVLHADDVTTGLLWLCTPENIPHGGLREESAVNYSVKGWVNEGMTEWWIDRLWLEGGRDKYNSQDRESYLKIICNKAVHYRIHTAIQTAQSDCQMVDDHMMGQIRVKVRNHLQQKTEDCNVRQFYLPVLT